MFSVIVIIIIMCILLSFLRKKALAPLCQSLAWLGIFGGMLNVCMGVAEGRKKAKAQIKTKSNRKSNHVENAAGSHFTVLFRCGDPKRVNSAAFAHFAKQMHAKTKLKNTLTLK